LLFDLALKRRTSWRGARLPSAVFNTRDQIVGPRHGAASTTT